MKRWIALLVLVVFALVPLSCAEEPEDREIYFEEDLSLSVLEEILLEKGDALLATDIPEKYMYVFQPVGAIAQIVYPIDENTSFSVMAGGDGTNILTLTVLEGEESAYYIGASEILSYIDAQKSE